MYTLTQILNSSYKNGYKKYNQTCLVPKIKTWNKRNIKTKQLKSMQFTTHNLIYKNINSQSVSRFWSTSGLHISLFEKLILQNWSMYLLSPPPPSLCLIRNMLYTLWSANNATHQPKQRHFNHFVWENKAKSCENLLFTMYSGIENFRK